MTDETSVNNTEISIDPTPTPEQLAAIAAAVQITVLSAATPVAPIEAPSTRWRFSGRWWARPVVLRRQRPAVY